MEDELNLLKDHNGILKKEVKTLFDNRKTKCAKGTTVTTTPESEFKPKVSKSNTSSDICFVLTADGEPVVRFVFLKVAPNFQLTSHSTIESESIETTISTTRVVAFIITKGCLSLSSFEFSMITAKLYNKPIIIIHDYNGCHFPSTDEQPLTVRDLFAEKAVTYLPEYCDVVAEKILAKAREAVKSVTSNRDMLKSSTYFYDLFLSHKRLTGQGIAGRLYEGLRDTFDIFLDTESQFSLEDLGNIVKNINTFVVVLSEGYLKSAWCIQEIRTAIQSMKEIVVVQDYLYVLPDPFPDELNDIKYALETSPRIKWMAEFNQFCIEKLKYSVLGFCPMKSLKHLPSWITSEDSKLKGLLDKEFGVENPLCLKNWEYNITSLVQGIDFYLETKTTAIKFDPQITTDSTLNFNIDLTSIDLSDCLNITDEGIDSMARICSSLLYLNLSNVQLLTDEALESLSTFCPNLISLNLSQLKFTDTGLRYLKNCSSLKSLCLSKCTDITDEGIRRLLLTSPNLNQIDVSDTEITDETLKLLCQVNKNISSLSVAQCSKITENGISLFVNSSPNLTDLIVSAHNSLRENNLKSLVTISMKRLFINGEFWHKFSISTAEIETFTECCPNLEHFGLFDSSKLNDNSIKILTERCPNLTNLTLERCYEITSDSLVFLLNLPKLTHLTLDNATNLKDDDVLNFSKIATNLIEFNLLNCSSLKNAEQASQICKSRNEFSSRDETLMKELVTYKIRNRKLEMAVKGFTKDIPTNENRRLLLASSFKMLSSSETLYLSEMASVLCYLDTTGAPAANSIKQQLKLLKVECEPLPVSIETSDIDYKDLYRNKASLIVILSSGCLKSHDLVEAVITASNMNMRIIMVHDADTCFFPAYSEQPDSIKRHFSEKAITTLKDYSDVAAKQIFKKIQDHLVKKIAIHNTLKSSPENLKTRMFLSHKRSTAQHIAGRLYEGFHEDYKVFLDSENEFEIGDLETIVNSTDVFVLILSALYFESQFCVAELNAAKKANKKIIVVRDCNFPVPKDLPHDLSVYPHYVWMAEYHTQCVAKISKDVFGASDKILLLIQEMKQQSKAFEKGLNERCFKFENPLDLTNIAKCDILGDILVGLQFNLGVNVAYIDLTNNDQIKDSSLANIAVQCPLLQGINLSQCINVSDKGLTSLALHCPKLEYLKLDNCVKITNKSLLFLADHCSDIKVLHLHKCALVDDEGVQYLAQKCTKLEDLSLAGLHQTTDVAINTISTCCKSLSSINLAECRNYTIKGIKMLIRGDLPLRKVNFAGYDGVGMCLAFQKYKELEEVCLRYNQFKNKQVLTLVFNCPKLKYLNLQHCELISDEALQYISALKEIERLNLNELASITDNGVLNMVDKIKKSLKEISLEGSPISDQCRATLATKYKLRVL